MLEFLRKKKGKDFNLLNFIKSCENNNFIVEHKLYYIRNLFKNGDNVKVYKTDSLKTISKMSFKLKKIESSDFLIFLINKNLYIIVEKWESLKPVITFLFENFMDKEDYFKAEMAKIEVDTCLKYNKNCLDDICKHYTDFAIKNNCLEIFQKIVPDRVFYKKNTYALPAKNSKKIDKLEIYTDPAGTITSVRINSEHPNSDKNGWFCLGTLKNLKLNKDGIDQLISNIKCYKLDDCYWKIETVKTFINKIK